MPLASSTLPRTKRSRHASGVIAGKRANGQSNTVSQGPGGSCRWLAARPLASCIGSVRAAFPEALGNSGEPRQAHAVRFGPRGRLIALQAIQHPITAGKPTPEAPMARPRAVTRACHARAPHPARRSGAGVAIARSIANTALAIAAFAPLWACAADRYALGSGAVVRSSDRVPATATMLSAKRYALHGGVSRGETDS